MKISEWVIAVRKALGYSQEKLGAELGEKTKGNISAWENGRHEPSYRDILMMSAMSKLPIPVPDGVDALLPSQGRTYPLISKVQAGAWTEAIDLFQPGYAEHWMPSPVDLGESGFLLEVDGDSMTNPHGGVRSFPSGTILHINPHIEAIPGDFVIAKRESENEATFKQYKLVDGEPYLFAINPGWPNAWIKLGHGDRIIGVMKHAGVNF